jgi:IS30 family transposase
MDREVVKGWIAEGLSLEQRGERAGRHPSTVSYWLRKHGLRAVGAEVHAARGPLEREELARLVEAGLSVRAIADTLSRSTASVRHWLASHGLETRLTEIRRRVAQADGQDLQLTCRRHGTATFRLRRYDGQYRCLRCQSEQVIARRRRLRAQLVAEAGGA